MLDKKSNTACYMAYLCAKQELMITITLDTIFNKAVEFSSFEAGRGVQDDSLLPTLLVTSKDKAFIQSYAEQAMLSLSALLKFCLENTSYEESPNVTYGFTFSYDCTLAAKSSTKRHLQEAMTAFVMSQWLTNKLPERAKAYSTMYTDMAGLLVSSAERIAPRFPMT